MPPTHLVVDGSNIATEGRSLPSLQQLLDAVDAVTEEFDHANVTVIVDATFGHRIDSSEREQYEEKVNSGQIITPPAGVIGRGDAFILEVADRANAIILSNDSFQEFHGTYDWLFTEGRLLGGKHVPGVGWIFLARSPVRGPTSRRAVSDAKRKRRGSKAAETKTPASKRPSSSGTKSASKSRSKSASGSSKSPARSKGQSKPDEPAGRKRGGKEPEPYNEPLPFIEFVGAHPVGSVIEAEIEQFASHGAYVVCDGTRCYISLKSISDPPPRSAREVLELGETREFVVKAIDTPRRGIDLAMPGMDLEASDDDVEPDDEPVTAADPEMEADAEPAAPVLVAAQAPTEEDGDRKLSVSQRRKLRAQQQADAEAAAQADAEAAAAPAKKAASTTRARAAAKKAAPDPKATDRKATDMATKKAATKKKAAPASAAKKAATKKKAAPAKKAAPKKATAKKAATKKAAPKKATAKKAATKKAAPKKATAKKAAPKKATAKKTAAKKSTAKKAAATKSAAKKAGPASRAKKSTAKKSATKRA